VFAAALGSGWSEPFSWNSVAETNKRLPGHLTRTFQVNKHMLSATYDLRLPKDHPLVAALETDTPITTTVADYLGAVYVNNERLAFKRPAVKVGADDLDATISVKSARMRLQGAESVVRVQPWPGSDCCLPPARVIVKTVGAQVVSTVPPTEQTTGRAVYSDVEGPFDLRLALTPSTPAKSSKRPVAGSSDKPDPIAMWDLHWMVQQILVPIGGQRLTIDVKRQALTATYNLELWDSRVDQATGPSLLETLRAHSEARDAMNLAKFLGLVSVDDRVVRFQPPVMSVSPGAHTARVSMTSVPMTITQREPTVKVAPPLRGGCCLPPAQVNVETEGAVVQWASEWMVAQSSKSTVFRGATQGIELGLVMASFDDKRSPTRPNSALLRRMTDAEHPGLGWALYWCAVLIPAALLIHWVRRGRVAQHKLIPASLRLVNALLAFYAIALVGSAVANFTGRWSLAVPVAEGLRRLGLWNGARPYGYSAAPALMLVGIAIVWPRFVRELGTDQAAQQPKRRLARLGAILLDAVFAAGLAVIVTVVSWFPTSPRELTSDPIRHALLTAAVAAVALSIVPWILVRALGVYLRRLERLAVVMALFLLLVVESLPIDSLPKSIVRAAIVIGAGTVTLLAVGRLGLNVAKVIVQPSWRERLSDRLSRFARPRQGGQRRWWLLATCSIGLAALALAIPTFTLVRDPSVGVGAWDLMSMSDYLILVLALYLGVVVLANLRVIDRDRLSILRPTTQYLGVLFTLTLLFDPWERFLYLPVPLLIGYVIVSRWLFLDRHEARWYRDVPPEGSSRAELVRQAIDSGWKLRHDKDKDKDKDKAGEASSGEGETSSATEAGWEQQEQIRRIQSAVLSLGPQDSPWQRGKVFARYSLWLSLGWVLIYFIPREMSLWLQNNRYLTLGMITVIIWNVVQWLALGFLLGYFYPIIRGSNGLWKGLSVAVAYITPWLIYYLLLQSVGRQNIWQPIVVWAVQVFVTSVLTGFLAGEVKTLRDAGYGINALMSVHNFSVLAAWGSSVAVAIIGAIVTLLTTTIGQVVTSQFTGGPKPPAP
jgi:hypothetical protein